MEMTLPLYFISAANGCKGEVFCWTCHNEASDDDCALNGQWRQCLGNTAVCEDCLFQYFLYFYFLNYFPLKYASAIDQQVGVKCLRKLLIEIANLKKKKIRGLLLIDISWAEFYSGIFRSSHYVYTPAQSAQM